MRIHYLIHHHDEMPGAVSSWAKFKNHTESYTFIADGDQLPLLSNFDALVIMGGPMNIYEFEKYPWLVDETDFIRDVIHSGKKLLGICLGAQLIANVLGGKVVQNHCQEIGWYPIQKTNEGKTSPYFSDFDESIPVLNWHGDTFNIPSGAKHLFVSEACKNQAFSYGENVLAVQFHFEMDAFSIDSMCEMDRASLVKQQWVMTEDEIKNGGKYVAENNLRLFTLLDRFFG